MRASSVLDELATTVLCLVSPVVVCLQHHRLFINSKDANESGRDICCLRPIVLNTWSDAITMGIVLQITITVAISSRLRNTYMSMDRR